MSLSERIRGLPALPGVYLMSDSSGRILYVGKAKNLKVRVRSYLKPGSDGRIHIKFLMDRATDLDWVVTSSEKDALILENTLIKKHKPRYNIDLKDDKTYLSLRVDLNAPFPRLDLVRRVKADGARYLGPYSSARDLRATLELLLMIFPLRSCSDADFKARTRPCLYHWTRGCPAPCCGLVDRAGYRALVDGVLDFLSGRNTDMSDRLEAEMRCAAEGERFEEAALLRDRLKAVRATLERQKIVSHSPVDRDVVGWVREGGEVEAAVMVVRGGALIDQRLYHLNGVLEEDSDFAAEFLRSYYRGDRIVPPEVVVQAFSEEDREGLSQWLSEKRGGKVRVLTPKRGERLEAVALSAKNAATALEERRKSKVGFETALKELAAALNLPGPPGRIECFDVSNIQGTNAVVGMVTFTDGAPDKALYRRFKIRTVEGSDDFAMLYEAISRRIARRDQEGWQLPDLMVIDGGRGQLSSALRAFSDAGVTPCPVVGLAKARTLGGEEPEKSPERVFLPGRMNPLILPRNSSALFLLMRVRDEAHRFSVAFHRQTRSKSALSNELLSIEGLGPKRVRALMTAFGSVKGVKAATLGELSAVPGMSERLAQAIIARFSGKD